MRLLLWVTSLLMVPAVAGTAVVALLMSLPTDRTLDPATGRPQWVVAGRDVTPLAPLYHPSAWAVGRHRLPWGAVYVLASTVVFYGWLFARAAHRDACRAGRGPGFPVVPAGAVLKEIPMTSPPPAVGTRPRRPGKVLIYAMMVMPVLLMMCAVVVDIARVYLVKTELERATQAAARAAVPGIQNGTYLDLANWVGAMNPADGTPVQFTMADVEIGRWDAAANTLIVGGGSPNAVRVTARRTVPASFGGWSGVNSKQVVYRATARFNVIGFGLVGLDWVNMSGNSTASYSSGGSGGLQAQGNIGSNGNITLGGSTVVNGNTFVGPGRTVTGGHVTGSRNTLSQPLSYPNGDASPYGPSNNDNGQIPSWANPGGSFSLDNTEAVSLPGGNYYFANFSMSGSSVLTFTGPATIYCYGTFNMAGRTNTSGNTPGNLKLVMVPSPWSGAAPGSVNVGSSAAFYGQIYAPQSAVSIGGTGDVYGSVLGKTVSMTGTGRVVYDLALEADNGTIALVE